jgi:nucleotide-binding universal stress UspA family protein
VYARRAKTAYSVVLCPLDFSDCSRHALEHALVVCTKFGSKLRVLHVEESDTFTGSETFAIDIEHEVLRALDKLLHGSRKRDMKKLLVELEDLGAVRSLPEVAGGDPASTILEAAKVVDMVVIGTHGRSGLKRLVLGSVAEKVVRGAPCPVLVVHGPPRLDKRA